MMSEDNRKINDQTAVSAQQLLLQPLQQQQKQQQQQQDGLMTTTRLTPFSIDNILGTSRDLAPASLPLVAGKGTSCGMAADSRVTSDQSLHVDTTKVVLPMWTRF